MDMREQLESEISRRNIRALQHSTPVTIDDVKKHIPDNAALIEYAVYMPYDIRMLKYGNPLCRVRGREIPASPDGRTLGQLRMSMRRSKRLRDWHFVTRIVKIRSGLHGHWMRRVMRPVKAELVGNAHLICWVSPDGELNVIPFGSLVDQNGKYAVESYTFTYLSSGRDLVRTGEKRSAQSRSLIIGNPAYGKPESGPTTKNPKQSASRARFNQKTRPDRHLFYSAQRDRTGGSEPLSRFFPMPII